MGEWMNEWMSLNISLAFNYESNILGFKEKRKGEKSRKSSEHFKVGVS